MNYTKTIQEIRQIEAQQADIQSIIEKNKQVINSTKQLNDELKRN